MPLPRNATAKNRNTHTKYAKGRDHIKKTSELDTICDRHQVGNLSFRACKFASAEGKITFIDHDHFRGNMRIGTLIVKAKELMPSADAVYDLVRLKMEKKERDEKKKMEETEKVRDEMQRLQNSNALDTLPEGDEHHNKLLQSLISDNTINDQPTEPTDDQPTEPITDDQPTETITDDQPTETITDDQPTESDDYDKSELENKTNDKSEFEKKANDRSGNKFYRKFIKDIRSKFTLVEEPNIKYLEVRAETTDMVIDNVRAYRIIMPEKIKEHYLMFIGHLQMKSGLLREIDPSYGFDKISREHNDLLERIKAKENSKTIEYDEKFLEDEYDDLEELCISDEENPLDKKTSEQINNSHNDDDDKIICLG